MASVKGTIKRLVSDKGFGFVAAQDGTEYFFHQSACTGSAFRRVEGRTVGLVREGPGPEGPARRARDARLARPLDNQRYGARTALQSAFPLVFYVRP